MPNIFILACSIFLFERFCFPIIFLFYFSPFDSFIYLFLHYFHSFRGSFIIRNFFQVGRTGVRSSRENSGWSKKARSNWISPGSHSIPCDDN